MDITPTHAHHPLDCIRRGLLTLGVGFGVALCLMAGCASDGTSDHSAGGDNARQFTDRSDGAPTAGAPVSAKAAGTAVAVYDGGAVALADLKTALFEAAGGQILDEWLLDRLVQRRLAERGLAGAVDDAAIARERAILLRTLTPATPATPAPGAAAPHAVSPDTDQAARILEQLRQRRGLGRTRFDSLLHRNAGLRRLVADQVVVTEIALEQAFQLQHGQRYVARLITTADFHDAVAVVRAAREGASFVDLAIDRSTDVSRQQGGRLEPISAADASYPLAIRAALARMEPGQVSDPIALDKGFAVLLLERKVPADAVQLDAVRDALVERVRLQAEATLMQQLARELLAGAEVLVLDPALQKSWTRHRTPGQW